MQFGRVVKRQAQGSIDARPASAADTPTGVPPAPHQAVERHRPAFIGPFVVPKPHFQALTHSPWH